MNKSPTPARLLVVDDEPIFLRELALALKLAGYEVLTCTTGEAVVALVAAHTPDLVILDVGLPDIDGYEVCQRLRTHATLPILFLTARHNEADILKGLAVGGDGYLGKPFSTDELLARLRALLRRHGAQLTPTLGRN